jgi:hypothetical protein
VRHRSDESKERARPVGELRTAVPRLENRDASTPPRDVRSVATRGTLGVAIACSPAHLTYWPWLPTRRSRSSVRLLSTLSSRLGSPAYGTGPTPRPTVPPRVAATGHSEHVGGRRNALRKHIREKRDCAVPG